MVIFVIEMRPVTLTLKAMWASQQLVNVPSILNRTLGDALNPISDVLYDAYLVISTCMYLLIYIIY